VNPDVVKIVHSNVRRVETHVRVIAVETSAQTSQHRLGTFREFPKRARFGPAVQWIRLAGASLIDEDDVALALDATEQFLNLAGKLRRTLAGSACEEHESVRFWDGCERREDSNQKLDSASNTGMAVFEDRHGAAQRLGRAFIRGAGVKSIERSPRGRDTAGGAGYREDREQGREAAGQGWTSPQPTVERPGIGHRCCISLSVDLCQTSSLLEDTGFTRRQSSGAFGARRGKP
jgi:hypothetical protein